MISNSKYKASELDIIATVNDFEILCSYLAEKRPMLSKQKEVLGKNDLFKINELLHFRKDVAAPNFQQESYPIIDLMFNLALLGKLFGKTGDARGNVYFEGTHRLLEFKDLNSFEKYFFLFETFWTKLDFTEAMSWRDDQILQIVQKFAKSQAGQKLTKGAFSKRRDHDLVFSYNSVLVKYFSYFGFCTFVPIVFEPKKFSKYEDNIKEVIPTEFGVFISEILQEQKLTKWNIPWLEFHGYVNWDDEDNEDDEIDDEDEIEADDQNDSEIIPLMRYLEPIFPEGILKNTVIDDRNKLVKGSYIFQVSLAKNVWRKIKVSFNHSLEDLHLAIQDAFDFDNDHLYSFFMDGKRYSRNAYHSPMGDEGPFTDEAIIGELGLYSGQKILYYFDYGDSWEFTVRMLNINEDEPSPVDPEIIEIKGEAPDQYRFEEDFDDSDDE